jgi:hypothetical protein
MPISDHISDPSSRHQTTGPANAIVAGIATGANEYLTGVYGYSKSGLAGFFLGSVELTGHTNVTGDLSVTGSVTVKGHSIDELLQRIEVLEAAKVTRNGTPVTSTTGRPELFVTFDSKVGDSMRFHCTGKGYIPGRKIVFNIVNLTQPSHIDEKSESGQSGIPSSTDFIYSSVSSSYPGGTLDIYNNINCSAGDQVRFVATDGREDPNDLTGILWSNTATDIARG